LLRAIESGGFLVGAHQGRYHLPESAATDPYTQCGFRKMICISHIRDFLLPHLPNKYVGQLGTPETDFFRQIQALKSIQQCRRPCAVLLNGSGETRLWQGRWSKSYSEPFRRDVLDLVPGGASRVLSYGCGAGALESELVNRGVQVKAVGLDSVIGACAEARGVDVVYGSSESVLERFSGEQFDSVLLSNLLHLVPNPEGLLARLGNLLAPRGVLVAIVPNHSQLPVLWGRISGDPALKNLGRYDQTGIHQTSARSIRRWFARAGLRVQKILPVIPRRAEWLHRGSARLFGGLLGSEFLVVGEKQ
jgi:SAM-dependent methyltransferase